MGRVAQGYKIRLHHSGIYHVRWVSTRTGKRYDLSLGTRDPVEAASRAAERYREVCERELAEPEAPAGDDVALDDELRSQIDRMRNSDYSESVTARACGDLDGLACKLEVAS